MREVYRKFGRVVRRENEFLIRVDEAGEAVEDGGTFACAPLEQQPDALTIAPDDVNAAADAIAALVRPPLQLERLIVSDGLAFHEFGEKRWSERTQRVHVSIARAPYRALIDLADFSTATIARICKALLRVGAERSVSHVRLAENVGAALLPSLIGALPMEQWAAPHDGKGEWIENAVVDDSTPRNWFRPSYRTRPVRAWFHLRADAFGAIDASLPIAIALLAPIHVRTLRLLCTDGDAAFVATVNAARVLAAAPTETWFPFAAGCFGAEFML